MLRSRAHSDILLPSLQAPRPRFAFFFFPSFWMRLMISSVTCGIASTSSPFILKIAFPVDDCLINLAHGHEIMPFHVFTQELFIGPHIHICFRTVFAKIRISVFDGINKPRINVQVVFTFNGGDAVTSFWRSAMGRCDALSKPEMTPPETK